METVYIAVQSRRLNEKFRSAIQKSNPDIKIKTFYTLNECRKEMTNKRPDFLLLGMKFKNGRGIDFCKEIRKREDDKKRKGEIRADYPALPILMITSHDEYVMLKDELAKSAMSMEELISGYISKDAWSNVIDSAIETLRWREFFCYNTFTSRVDKEFSIENSSFVDLMILEITKEAYDAFEKIKKAKKFIRALELYCLKEFTNMTEENKERLDAERINKYKRLLIENLLVHGHSNWKIAEMLNEPIDTIRIHRMQFIHRISGESLAFVLTNQGKQAPINDAEKEILLYTLLGYTNQEMADVLCLSLEAIKTYQKNLKDKFRVRDPAIKALLLGIIKVEGVGELKTRNLDEEKPEKTETETPTKKISNALQMGLITWDEIEKLIEERQKNKKINKQKI